MISPLSGTGHSVGFDLPTHGNRQFAAFYDADRHMTVAARTLDSDSVYIRLSGTAATTETIAVRRQ